MTLSGLRTSAEIERGGGSASASLNLAIYGMTLSEMNQASFVPSVWNVTNAHSQITVQAGEATGSMTTVFKGEIFTAMIDALSEPQVSFRVSATELGGPARLQTPVISKPGAVQAKTLFEQIAKQCKLTFEDGGITGVIRNPYLWGSPIIKARHLAEAMKCGWCIDGPKGVFAAWPQGGSRSGANPVISKATGMVASPSFSNNNLIVKTLFNPSVSFQSKVTVKSDIVTGANASWLVNDIILELDAFTPRGRWFQTLRCTKPITSQAPGDQ